MVDPREPAGQVRQLDVFGADPELQVAAAPACRWLAERFFRTEVLFDGSPAWSGPVLLVANHGGFLPVDALVLKTVLDPLLGRFPLRPLLEDYVFTLPWIGTWMARLGCVRASQDNASRLLAGGQSVLAFPEGVKGAGKTVFERGRVMRFGRGGLVRLALRTGTPVVPIGLSGPGEAYPVLARLGTPGRMMGLPFLPVTPTFPLLGAAGLIPLPSRFRVLVGEPMDLHEVAGSPDPDEAAILRVNEVVRGRVAELVRRAAQGT